jgi:hypothetical protein
MRRAAVAAAFGVAVALGPGFVPTARAEPPSPELMAKLTAYADTFQAMRTRASVTISGTLHVCDGAGNVQSTTTMTVRAEGHPNYSKFHVLQYVEDGVDKTEEAKHKPPAGPPGTQAPRSSKPLRIPLLPRDQPLYTFDVVEVDRADPARLRVAFAPKHKADDTIEGSAWVDSRTGQLISVAFKLDKTPTFVDFVNVVIEFGETTSLGPAISKVKVDAEGGFLFFRRKFHGVARFTDYSITP